MKLLKTIASKLIEKIKENPQASTRLGIFITLVCLAYAYPIAGSIVGALACMVAIDHRAKAKDSLTFLKIPSDVAKVVAAETKKTIDAKSAESKAAKEAKNSPKAPQE